MLFSVIYILHIHCLFPTKCNHCIIQKKNDHQPHKLDHVEESEPSVCRLDHHLSAHTNITNKVMLQVAHMLAFEIGIDAIKDDKIAQKWVLVHHGVLNFPGIWLKHCQCDTLEPTVGFVFCRDVKGYWLYTNKHSLFFFISAGSNE